MKTVLVTAIGTVTSTAIVKQLKQTGNYYIIGADINERNRIATSKDVDEYYKFPYSTEETYIPFALSFCKNHKVDYYYAVIDKEVVNLAKNREAFLEIGTKLCIVNSEFANITHFKNRFSEWIENNISEIAIKRYISIEKLQKANYPLFCKPIEGVASTGCKIVNSFEELSTIISLSDFNHRYLIQDYVEGQVITVDCIRNRKTNQKVQIQRKELLRNTNGCGIAVEIINNQELGRVCDYLMESLDLNGVANFEFFETNNGFRIIEINPRFSAGTLYSCMAGIDTVMNAMYIADEKRCVFGEISVGAHFAERYEAYRLD